MSKAKFIQENGETILPITHEEAVLDNDGKNLPSKYQQKQDESLLTESKTIVGAINELSTKGGGGGEGTITSVPYTEGSDLDIEQVGGINSDDVIIADTEKTLTKTLVDTWDWIQGNENWLQEVDNLARTNYNKIGETELATTDKTLTGAINELFQSANNGKELIADAIGEPLDASDTFSAMSDDINSLLSTFKTNMMNNGVTVESGDKFKALIDKVATMVEEGEGKGIQFAEGEIVDNYPYTATHTYNFTSSLNFTPTYIFVKFPVIGRTLNKTSYTDFNAVISNIFSLYIGSTSANDIKITSVTSTGFTVTNTDSSQYYGPSDLDYTIKWYAVGVGEEDTTLRDSLASILTEEGVEVTEEDDMASLITKVDNEFDDNRSRLYELMSDGGYEVDSSMSLDSLLDLLELSGIGVSEIKQIVSTNSFTFVLKTDGSLLSCGYNSEGQLGLGTSDTNVHGTFTQVTTNINKDVKQVACGSSHTFILKNDGSVWACGYNYYGQLGLGNTTSYNSFTQVTTNINNDVKQIACGSSHTFILKDDGSVWSCGYNHNGELGLNDDSDRNTFTQVTTNINNDVKQIACGGYHSFILKNDGSIWGCGRNTNGQLGLEDTTTRTTFTQVTTNINNDVSQVYCGGYHSFILKNDGSIWGCGNNSYGHLGLEDTTTRTTFTQVTTNINNDVKQIACGNYFTFILKNDGSIWSCGNNYNGQLGWGSSDTDSHSTFTQVTTNINNDVKQIACGYSSTFILKNDGSLYGCGYNNYGQLGLIDSTQRATFTPVPSGI